MSEQGDRSTNFIKYFKLYFMYIYHMQIYLKIKINAAQQWMSILLN